MLKTAIFVSALALLAPHLALAGGSTQPNEAAGSVLKPSPTMSMAGPAQQNVARVRTAITTAAQSATPQTTTMTTRSGESVTVTVAPPVSSRRAGPITVTVAGNTGTPQSYTVGSSTALTMLLSMF